MKVFQWQIWVVRFFFNLFLLIERRLKWCVGEHKGREIRKKLEKKKIGKNKSKSREKNKT